MKKTPLLAALTAAMAAFQCANAALPRVKAELTYAPNVPPPITRRKPAIVEVHLTATHKIMPLAWKADYQFWTFNGHVPGPFIRARIGDWLEVHLANADPSGMPHNVDFHAATGPGGGAPLLTVVPGTTNTAWLRLREPGLFMYHCAVSPMIDHIGNGMYGLILVEPAKGLPHPTANSTSCKASFTPKTIRPTRPRPTRPVRHCWSIPRQCLGRAPALRRVQRPIGFDVVQRCSPGQNGRTSPVLFRNAGPDLISSFHIIGTIMENVHRDGGLTDPPAHGLQTTLVTPGAAAVVKFTPLVPVWTISWTMRRPIGERGDGTNQGERAGASGRLPFRKGWAAGTMSLATRSSLRLNWQN